MAIELSNTIRKEVESRAFDMYEARMQWGIPGDALSDWLQSEKEVYWYRTQDLKEHARQFSKVIGINV